MSTPHNKTIDTADLTQMSHCAIWSIWITNSLLFGIYSSFIVETLFYNVIQSVLFNMVIDFQFSICYFPLNLLMFGISWYNCALTFLREFSSLLVVIELFVRV